MIDQQSSPSNPATGSLANRTRRSVSESVTAGMRRFRVASLIAASRWFMATNGLSAVALQSDPHAVKSLVVFKLDELGDVVLASSFLAELRAQFPSAHITLVVKSSVIAVVADCPHVNEVIGYDAPAGSKATFAHIFRPMEFGRKLGRLRLYDLAINTRWDRDAYGASVMAVFAKAARRISFTERVYAEKAREYRGYDSLSTLTATCDLLVHEAEKPYALLDAMGLSATRPIRPLEYWSPPANIDEAATALATVGIAAGEPYVVVCASTGHSPLKAWPASRFVALIGRIRDEHAVPVVLAGSSVDLGVTKEILSALNDDRVASLCGALSIGASAEMIRGAVLFVGCDAGLSHVAAAVGTPQITLFGSSCSHRFRPWSPVARTVAVELPCGPCAGDHTRDRCRTCIYPTTRCMEAISVDDVTTQASQILQPMERTIPSLNKLLGKR